MAFFGKNIDDIFFIHKLFLQISVKFEARNNINTIFKMDQWE